MTISDDSQRGNQEYFELEGIGLQAKWIAQRLVGGCIEVDDAMRELAKLAYRPSGFAGEPGGGNHGR